MIFYILNGLPHLVHHRFLKPKIANGWKIHPFNRPSKRLINTKFLLVHPLVQNHPMVIFCCEGYTRMLFIRTFPNLLVQRLLLVPRNLHLLPPPSHPLKLRFLSEERNRFHHLLDDSNSEPDNINLETSNLDLLSLVRFKNVPLSKVM